MAGKPTYDELEQKVKELEKETREQKRLDKRLQLLSLAIEQSSEGIAVVDLDGNLEYLNVAFARMHGYSVKELIGKNLSIFHTPPQMPSVEAANRQIKKTGNFKGEIWHVTCNGTEFPTLMHNSLLRDDIGNPIGIIGTLRDITDLKSKEEEIKASEVRFRDLFNYMSNGVAIYEAKDNGNDFIFKDFNPAGERIENFKKENLLGKNVLEVFPGVKEFGLFDVFKRVWETGKPEHHPISMYQDERIIGWRENYVYKLPSGEIVAVYDDITERKRAEEQIKTSLKEKEILLSEIHHRVKNNMQVIISLLRLRAEKIEDKKYADMFKEGEDRIRSMSLVYEQLYQSNDFANIDFGEYIKNLANGLFTFYGVDTNKVKLNIEIKDVLFDLENAIPCGLIINELVSNSLKHAFPQNKEGHIAIDLQTINEDELELTVSDDGVGIPEDLDIEQTDTMGLNLVKVLAGHQLDGKIDLDRTDGTQFNIKFKRTAYKPRI